MGRRALARLGAVGLTIAASLPGRLQLVHHHGGGERAHVHADAESLAAHDLLEQHEERAHAHPHGHDHPHPHRHARDTEATYDDGPALWAVATDHVHGLNPFHQMARTRAPGAAPRVAIMRVAAGVPREAPDRPRHTVRSRGPPTLFVG